MRQHAINLVVTRIGDGRVDLETALEDLLRGDPRESPVAPRPPAIEAPSVPRTTNLRLAQGIAQPRPGYVAFAGAAPAANPITGLITARYDNNTNEILRCDYNTIRPYFNGAWSSPLSFDVALKNANTGLSRFWRSTMVRRAFSSFTNQLFLSNGHDDDPMYRYYGGGATILATAAAYFRGPRAIIGNRGRCLAANVYDVGTSSRKYQRVWLSRLGDPTDFTGTGSGFVDLDDDAYPIVGGVTVGSNVAVLKGTAHGGSVIVGTLTGISATPYRWDTQNTGGIGLLFPRTLISITPDVVFFFGHDNMYLFDGARGLRPVGEEIIKHILSRVNYDALGAPFAYYRPKTREIYVGLALDGATVPNEFWIIDLPSRRPYGPFTYAAFLTAVTDYSLTGVKRIGDFAPGETFGGHASTPIGNITGDFASGGFILGASNGATYLDDGTATSDAGTSISIEYRIGSLVPFGYVVVHPTGNQRVTDHDTYYELKDIALIFRNKGVWTPVVSVSTDGGTTFTTVSDGSTAGSGSNTNKMLVKNYSCEVSGQWFLVRVTGGTGAWLQAMRFEFSYAGSGRNE